MLGILIKIVTLSVMPIASPYDASVTYAYSQPMINIDPPAPHFYKIKTPTLFESAPHTHAGLVAWSKTLPYPWPIIINCESIRDDSWPASSSSPARGPFQFLRSSWRLVGGIGDPAAASWREQYRRAKLLRKMFGINSWACARITGVS